MQGFIFARTNTVVKRLPVENSTTLSASDKFDLLRGQSLEIERKWYVRGNNHYRVQLTSPRGGTDIWYVYIPHVEFIPVFAFEEVDVAVTA